MKKSTLINKFESKLDLTLDALYEARDVISTADDYELDELVNEIVEDLEMAIADSSEKIQLDGAAQPVRTSYQSPPLLSLPLRRSRARRRRDQVTRERHLASEMRCFSACFRV